MSATLSKADKLRRTKSAGNIAKPVRSANGTVDVLTLAEAAKYLRVTEADVLSAIIEQKLLARRVGKDWRFLKTAIQQWLLAPQLERRGKAALQSLAGVWKDDPSVEPMLTDIYRQRGRPIMEVST